MPIVILAVCCQYTSPIKLATHGTVDIIPTEPAIAL